MCGISGEITAIHAVTPFIYNLCIPCTTIKVQAGSSQYYSMYKDVCIKTNKKKVRFLCYGFLFNPIWACWYQFGYKVFQWYFELPVGLQ